MGILDFLQKKMAGGPAIAGTADTIAKQYLMLKGQQPKAKEADLYKTIIEQRYSLIPLKDERRYELLIASVPKIENLQELVFRILCAETELLETDEGFRQNVFKVIEDRLKKFDLK